jgi:hypothetical protein
MPARFEFRGWGRAMAAFLAVCAGAPGPSRADVDSPPPLSLSGFGTLAAVRSGDRDLDFVSSLTQPNGAGYTRRTDFGPDTRMGLQLNATFTEHWSAVAQAVSQHQYDNTYRPLLEWANLKYAIEQDWSVRVGRVALPVGMVSDYRQVGYSNPWIRPPMETYSILPVTSIDGVDSIVRWKVGPAINSLQVLVGGLDTKFAHHGLIKARDTWFVGDTVELQGWTFRASFASSRLYWSDPASDALFDGLASLGSTLAATPGQSAGAARATDLAIHYRANGQRAPTMALGIAYDQGPWLWMAEWIRLVAPGFLADNSGAYVTAAYRIGAFTPYVTLAKLKSDLPPEPGLAVATLPGAFQPAAGALDAGLQSALAGNRDSQSTVSAGVRWDLRKNIDLKLQVDRTRTGSGSQGQFVNVQRGFVPGSTVNLVGLGLDFVF